MVKKATQQVKRDKRPVSRKRTLDPKAARRAAWEMKRRYADDPVKW